MRNAELPDLLAALSKTNLLPGVIREILESASGFKIMRTLLSAEALVEISEILDQFSLSYGISSNKYLSGQDQGKGGFSNKCGVSVPIDCSEGFYFIYVGNNQQMVYAAKSMEENGKDDEFGELLGIPACCRIFYDKYKEAAFLSQNDFVPFVAASTLDLSNCNSWANIMTQYFGFNLFSYFPCSFNCEKTISQTQKTYAFLEGINSEFALQFSRYQNENYLYTERDGIVCFHQGHFDQTANVLSYDSGKIETTSEGLLFSSLLSGSQIQSLDNRLRILESNSIIIDVKKYQHCLLNFSAPDAR